VAASFLLPRQTASAERYVWLFGDTFVGTSNGKKRLEVAMISNSVAVSEVADGRIVNMDFYWRSTAEGEPCGVFECQRVGNTSLWPVSGLSVQTDDGLKSVVLAQRTKVLSANSRATGLVTESLRFTLVDMVALRIDNPTESPLSWRYSSAAFPRTSCFQWYLVACVRCAACMV
jgi:hypothetical protein